MESLLHIWNHALLQLGVTSTVVSETERTKEARVCARFWPTVRKQVLRDFAWPFATRFVALALVEEDPTDEWGYSYRYPSDCLYFRRILSGSRNDNPDQRVPYKIAGDDDGNLIYTDMDEAECEYTVDHEDYIRWPEDALVAAANLLAFYCAPALATKDAAKMGQRSYGLYRAAIASAQGNVTHEEQKDLDPPGELIRARE